ncbi:glycosyltransferase family 8 protein [Aporhodopirellula aestuarii]|uniref:Glycosyltransferase family 8 protein n=1 Tax=Aporhodopirellula aestuarii TaxID=2950107 RepID=A0ABT0U111_9BACT|nr:glycosyltransferase family 8 protein [Aporhodopirellula aestuarii]MCM2370255.1 glycosyltransferase family 8 protein [Aporhodopirellula aestuarii]
MLASDTLPAEQCSHRSKISNRIDVVCAADDAYVMPLAVTLKSSCRHLAAGKRIRLFLLAGDIGDENWSKLERTLAGEAIEIHLIKPDRGRVSDLNISHHISHTAYFRLLTAELVPDDVDKVIYLDSDLYVKDDLAALWDLPVQQQYCLATTDIACPFIDARLGCTNFPLANPYMAAWRPIPNYRELGLDGAGEYFNSGVMVLNVQRWREDNVAERLLKVLRDNRKYVWCWDQYALNVLFHGQWGRFEPRWNQGAHVFEYPSDAHAPIDRELWIEMKTNPAIVHFTTEFKPWQAHSNHPRSEVFFEGLTDTAWKNWRTPVPPPSFQNWFNRRMVELIKRSTITSRKIASAWAVS